MNRKQDSLWKYFAFYGMLLFVGISIMLAGKIEDLCQLDFRNLSIISLLIMLFVISYVVILSGGKTLSVYNIYLFVFCLFHFGLIIIYGLGFDISSSYKAYLKKWYFSYYGNYAIVLVTIGLSAIASGVLLMLLLSSRKLVKEIEVTYNERQGRVLTITGFLFVAVSTVGWFYVTLRFGGISLLTGSYQSFLKTTEGYLSGWYFYFPLGWGLIILTIASPSKLRRFGMLIFLLFALVALPLGLRGEVLFPAFSALAAAGMKGMSLDLKKSLILGVCLLCAISVLKQVRHVGIEKVRLSEVVVAPLDSLAEMGSSIRPVVAVSAWAASGEDFIYGQSYWAPIDRLLVYLIPGWSRPMPRDDDRLLNILIQERIGPIGFSTVAEAYRNFGKYGVCIVMFLTGMLLAWIDMLRPTNRNCLIAAFVLFPLLVQVRNAFVMVPANIIVGLIIIFVIDRFSITRVKPN